MTAENNVFFSIIAVTGLAGHAFRSWAHSEENMWLRDDVHKFAPNARILTYGYNTPLVGSNISVVRISDLSDTFYENLIYMREDSKVSFILTYLTI